MGFKDRLLLLLNLLAAKRFGDQGTTHWDHKDTTKWIKNYPSCGGSYQSPINLEDTNTIGSLHTPLQFENYDETFIDDLLFENNGHSAEIALPETASGSRPMIRGGLLNDTYEAHSVHFHWGSLLKQGSEHAINGHRYAGEMHIVHMNTKYKTGDEASENLDGIAVLGIMLDIVDNPKKKYSGLNKVFKKLSQIRKFETNTTISQDLSLSNFLGDINTNKFYAYKGSLTTPPCSEAVTWHVLAEPLKISRLKMLFRIWVNTNSRCFLKNKLGTYEAENGVNLKMKANYKIKAKRFGDQGTIHWDHKDTTKWITNYPSCGGSYQSPINLEDTNTIRSLQTPLQFENYDETFIDDLLFENNGHSAEIALPETASGSRPMIRGGLLNDTYEAHSVHFHWGSLVKQGSEHVINGHRYAAEMHIVHMNTKYKTGDEASENSNGIAVLGIMLDIVDDPKKFYSGLNKVFEKLSQIRKFETNTTISQDLSLSNFLGDINTNKFYAYKGSLTTPPCSEAVTWHVLAEPLQISRLNISNLFTLTTEDGKFMVNNNRPVQALNNREIYSLA